ncbi:protein adenylyltransferase SelO [Phenylobacterium montanum]|uniref:Protein nucleotidyltransferase YdiU n=1 Tax=Phenylobacterium montanum TaxID=2823693 RepID=A0A975FXH8_9CAUL|nr:YdiU family protein [Caulobacter sp. S6]QUD87283.1 YdiU family protein [Caulobacter sp. S6]
MPVSPAYRPDPRFMRLGPDFADPVAPADFPARILRFRNDRAAASVGLEGLSDEEWLAAFAGFEALPDNQPGPLAMRYHGHQFRVYNPDLGDGRGFLFAQLREAETGRLLDLATKGSGRTPWSRGGDGRLTLKGGVREVLAAEMLQALGVPTSRAFSLVETGEALQRGDEPSPTRSAVLTRLSHSHIRFGSFQRHASEGRADNIQRLVDHAAEDYYPELMPREGGDRGAGLLALAVQASARLVARWMAAGFVHGVLNTDNLNITGESFDYGPWRFLPRNDPNFTAAYFDQTGLYSFGRQPEAVFWNLQQLAACLALVAEENALVEALNGFSAAYRRELTAAMLNRLGVKPRGDDEDVDLVNAAFRALASGGEPLRWEPFFFDWFCGETARALKGPRAEIYANETFMAFRERLAAFEPDRPERLADPYFAQGEPEELLYEAVEGLWAPIDQADDWSAFEAKVAAIRAAGAAWRL